MRTCKLIIDNAIVDSVNDKVEALDTGRTAHNESSVVVCIITGHCFMGTHTRRFGLEHLANALWVRMRGALVLNILLTTSVEAAEMK